MKSAIIYIVGLMVFGAGLTVNLLINGQESSGVTITCPAVPTVDYQKIADQVSAYNKKKKYAQAIEFAQQYMKDPNNTHGELWNNIGCSYTWLKEYEKAEETFLKGLNFEPDRPFLHFNIGYIYWVIAQLNG